MLIVELVGGNLLGLQVSPVEQVGCMLWNAWQKLASKILVQRSDLESFVKEELLNGEGFQSKLFCGLAELREEVIL